MSRRSPILLLKRAVPYLCRKDGVTAQSSLTEIDGFLESPEDITAVEPGARVGFVWYAALID